MHDNSIINSCISQIIYRIDIRLVSNSTWLNMLCPILKEQSSTIVCCLKSMLLDLYRHVTYLHYSLYRYVWRNSVRSRHLHAQSSDCLCMSSNEVEFFEWQHWNKSYHFLPCNIPFLLQRRHRHHGQNQEHRWRSFYCGLVLTIRDKLYLGTVFNLKFIDRPLIIISNKWPIK